jgi:Spy/CpxP family protein refolding chaperone
MTAKILIPYIAAALVIASQPADVSGQPRADRVAQNNDDESANSLSAKRAKVRQRIRALRAWRLTEALDLDEATAGKLFPILSRYDNKLSIISQEGSKLRRELRKLVRKGGTGSQFDKLIDKLVAQQKKMWKLQERRFADVRKVLTPEQAAKIMVLLPEIDRRIQQQIRQAMRKARKDRKAGKAGKRGKRRRGPSDDGIRNPF